MGIRQALRGARGRLLIAAGTVALLAAPAAAGATERFATSRGPLLGAGGLVWARVDSGGRLQVVRAAGAGRPRPLLTVSPDRPPTGTVGLSADLAVSDSHVAVEVLETRYPSDPRGERGPHVRRVWAGRPEGGLSLRAGPCDGPGPAPLLSAGVALAATRLAFAGPGCDERSVIDLDTGTRGPLPAVSTGLVAEGDFVAWYEAQPSGRSDLVVRNVAVGTQYRIADAPIGRIDVDDAGRIAMAYRGSSGADMLSWASPAAPELRTAAAALGDVRAVAVADGRAALLEVPFRRGSDGINGRLRLVDLEGGGGPRTVGTGLNGGPLGREPLDYDGRQVAVTVYRCGRVELLAAALGAKALRTSPARVCRLRMVRRPRIRAGRLRASVSCAGYARGCRVDRVVASVEGRVVASSHRDQPAVRTRMALNALGRQLARRDRLRRVRLTAWLSDEGFVARGAFRRRHTALVRVATGG